MEKKVPATRRLGIPEEHESQRKMMNGRVLVGAYLHRSR
jgi:hypothetical protein